MTRAIACGVFALSLALTGCGTVKNFTRPAEGEGRPLEVYGGVTRSVDTLKVAATNGDLVEASYAPLHASDVVLSAIGDTLTLPITATVTAWRLYEESRLAPPPPPANDKPLTPERIHGGII